MSIDVDTEPGADPDRIEELAAELGAAVADTPEHRAFAAATRAVQESEEAQERIQAFERQRTEFTMARQIGEATQEDLVELQTVQEELHSLPVMADFIAAQEELADRLDEVNEALSGPLAVDFSELSGTCCQDG